MSATPPVPQPDDFDAAVDAFVSGAAPAEQDTTVPVAEPPKAEATQPATAPSTVATTATDDDSDDEALPVETRFTRAQKREERSKAERETLAAERDAEKRRALSYQGNLAQEAERRKQLTVELAQEKQKAASETARIESYWQEAIKAAPEEQKAAYQEAYELDKEKRQIAADKQEIQAAKDLVAQFGEQRRTQGVQEMRQHATTELPMLIDQFAQANKLPATLFNPVKEYVDSPIMRALAKSLQQPFSEQYLPGDPASWPIDQLDSVHALRLHLQAQAENGLAYYTAQHEQEQIKRNVAKAADTYQPEKAVGAGGAAPRSFNDMDFDEAVDAFVGGKT